MKPFSANGIARVEPQYIPRSREKEREQQDSTRPVYEILADINRLQAEQDALLARLEELIS